MAAGAADNSAAVISAPRWAVITSRAAGIGTFARGGNFGRGNFGHQDFARFAPQGRFQQPGFNGFRGGFAGRTSFNAQPRGNFGGFQGHGGWNRGNAGGGFQGHAQRPRPRTAVAVDFTAVAMAAAIIITK